MTENEDYFSIDDESRDITFAWNPGTGEIIDIHVDRSNYKDSARNPYYPNMYLFTDSFISKYEFGEEKAKKIYLLKFLDTVRMYRQNPDQIYFPNGAAIIEVSNGLSWPLPNIVYVVKINNNGTFKEYFGPLKPRTVWSSDASYGYYITEDKIVKIAI